MGRDAQRAAWVTGEVPALAGVRAGLEPAVAIDPQCADAGDVWASVRLIVASQQVCRFGPPVSGAWLTPASSLVSIRVQSSSGVW